MLINTIETSIYNWAHANVPRLITFDGGGLDSGFVEVNINSTLVTQNFDTDKETTLQALTNRIINEVPEVANAILYYSLGLIRIIPANNVALTIVINNQFFPSVIMGVENSVTVIWIDENGPRPELPYISLKLSSYNSTGNISDLYPVNDAGILETHQIIEFILSIQAYGEESFQILKDLQQSTVRWSVRQDLYSNGGICFFNDFGGVRDISRLIGSREEKRAVLELTGRTYDSFKDKVGIIDTVNFQSTINQPSGNIINNFSISSID